MIDAKNIRNVAIIAHVDHGKTTLVDFLLKQSHTFRDNEAEMGQTTILDSNPLERERGITILAKNTAVEYKGYKINIIDTPGHADFSGEVERTLNMADGALLIIDAAEGPMPQTKFVLKKALELGLKVIVVINKIDKPLAAVEQTLSQTHDLFLELATHEDQLEFPTLYAIGREGKSWYNNPNVIAMRAEIRPNEAISTVSEKPNGIASGRSIDLHNDDVTLEPLFETIINYITAPAIEDGSFQMLVTALDYDTHKGKHIIGRIKRGTAKKGLAVVLLKENDQKVSGRIETIAITYGLKKTEVDQALAGDIVNITGIPNASIGDTLADAGMPEVLPRITIEEPTIKITMGPNSSPFAGKEGKFTNFRQILERLQKELETNVALKLENLGDRFVLSGRGELHLSVLIETLRREGYEFEVSKPQVITQVINDIEMEPMEDVIIDVPDVYVGIITQEFGVRKGLMKNMQSDHKENTRFEYTVPSKNLLGIRSTLLTNTKGTAVINTISAGYQQFTPPLEKIRNGVLVASESGTALSYGLITAQERGTPFIEPGTNVYEGMIVGLNSRKDDIDVNVIKGKKLTNMRASNSDISIVLTPPLKMSLEQHLDFIEEDELLEITPQNLRPRKKFLSKTDRTRFERTKN